MMWAARSCVRIAGAGQSLARSASREALARSAPPYVWSNVWSVLCIVYAGVKMVLTWLKFSPPAARLCCVLRTTGARFARGATRHKTSSRQWLQCGTASWPRTQRSSARTGDRWPRTFFEEAELPIVGMALLLSWVARRALARARSRDRPRWGSSARIGNSRLTSHPPNYW